MDKQERTAIMAKFLNKNKNKNKPSSPPKPQTITNNTTSNQGFYDTLIIKQNLNTKKVKNTEICKNIGNINVLMKKKYMIPSQFPIITQTNQLKSVSNFVF